MRKHTGAKGKNKEVKPRKKPTRSDIIRHLNDNRGGLSLRILDTFMQNSQEPDPEKLTEKLIDSIEDRQETPAAESPENSDE
jgi:hypothetical protein